MSLKILTPKHNVADVLIEATNYLLNPSLPREKIFYILTFFIYSL